MITEAGEIPPFHILTLLLTLVQLPWKSSLVPRAVHWDEVGREWMRQAGRKRNNTEAVIPTKEPQRLRLQPALRCGGGAEGPEGDRPEKFPLPLPPSLQPAVDTHICPSLPALA